MACLGRANGICPVGREPAGSDLLVTVIFLVITRVIQGYMHCIQFIAGSNKNGGMLRYFALLVSFG